MSAGDRNIEIETEKEGKERRVLLEEKLERNEAKKEASKRRGGEKGIDMGSWLLSFLYPAKLESMLSFSSSVTFSRNNAHYLHESAYFFFLFVSKAYIM